MVYVMLGLQNATEEHQADPEVLDCLNLKVTKENTGDYGHRLSGRMRTINQS